MKRLRNHLHDKLLAGVIEGMRTQLAAPEVIKAAARAYHDEWSKQEAKSRADIGAVRKQLTRVEVQIERIVTAITDSDERSPSIRARRSACERLSPPA